MEKNYDPKKNYKTVYSVMVTDDPAGYHGREVWGGFENEGEAIMFIVGYGYEPIGKDLRIFRKGNKLMWVAVDAVYIGEGARA